MKTKTEKFIDKIILKNNPKHFNKDGSLRYDYSKTNYIHSKTKVIIVCPIHGDFEQIPNNHLLGSGCTNCRHTFTTESFIEKANKVHSNKYDYSKTIYNTSTDNLIIGCSIHGDFTKTSNIHLSGSGCPKCGIESMAKSKKYDKILFEEKANKVHNNKYNYTKTIYKHSQTLITITCDKHGDFEQLPYSHLNGHGCLRCGSNGGGSVSTFIDNCIKNNKGLGILYVIRCFNDTESFYKVGITSKSIKYRFRNKYIMPYEYEVIHEVHREPEAVYNMENSLLRRLAKNSYQPLTPFAGQTECFTDIEALYKILKNKLSI